MNKKKLDYYVDYYKNSKIKFLSVPEFISFIDMQSDIKNKECLVYIFKKIEYNANITNFIREYRKKRRKNFLKTI
jgi:hypothetical protein